MTRHPAHRPRVLATLIGMVLGGLMAGTATVAAQTGIGSILESLSDDIALAGPPGTGGASTTATAGNSGPTLARPPVSAEWTQPGVRPTTPSPRPEPTTRAATTTTTRQPPTSRSTQLRLTVRPDVTSAPPTSNSPAPTSAPEKQLSRVERVVRLVNEVRAEHGCDAVTVDERIARAARKHSADMAARDYFSHDTLEGVGFAERIRAEGYPQPGAENIAEGFRSAADVMAGWLDSDGHRANILNCDLTTIGVGLDTDGWLWTQDFGY